MVKSDVKQTLKAPGRKRALKSPKAQPPTKSVLSAEFVHDTSDEESEGSSPSSKRSPTRVLEEVTPARKAQIQAPGATAKSRFTRPIEKTLKKQKSKSPSPSSASSGASQSDEDGKHGSSNASESETENSSQSTAQAPKKTAPKAQQPPSAAPVSAPYKPPSGFEKSTMTSSTSSTLADLFSPSNLRGKQIWHFTVPGPVPIGLIKEVAAQNVRNGASILCYKDTDYGLIGEVEGENTKKTLLLPLSKSNDYKDASVQITRTLHLQQLVQLPNLSQRLAGQSDSATKPWRTHIKAVRQQPEGLRMRYRPFGDSESSSSESPEQTSTFRAPPVVGTPQQAKKKKHDIAKGQDPGYQDSHSKSNIDALETPRLSNKRKHDVVNSEERENEGSTVKPKKRKHEKATNSEEPPTKSNSLRPPPDTASDTLITQISEETPGKTPRSKSGSPEPIDDHENATTIPITLQPKQSRDTKEQKNKRKEEKRRQKQTEPETLEPSADFPKQEAPSRSEQNKLKRPDVEKRRRKEEHQRSKEARKIRLKDQENQPDVSSCELPNSPNVGKKFG